MNITIILGAFGALCFVVSTFFSADVKQPLIKDFSGKGGVMGPISVNERNASYKIYVNNPVTLNGSGYVEINLLDANKNHLFGFGGEMWYERGRDAEGPWVDKKSDYTMETTIKKRGQYYFDVIIHNNPSSIVTVKVVQERGSKVPFLTLGIISLLFSLLAYLYFSGRNSSKNTAIIVIAFLSFLFIVAIIQSYRGYGYMGYHGYFRGPSFFYWGGPTIYHDRSHRNGSIGSTSHRGGGLSGGK